ncbi:MAG: ABC transporter ATP-binding protein [Chloracidobacterium sp.]|nr:ABC transporter ATP-binding protein [Chloracidobacterium sp.]
MAVSGEITAGNFASFILYLQRMIWYLIALGYVVNLYQRGTASLKRFNAILDAEPAIRDTPEARPQPPIKGGIEFRDLNFAYQTNGSPPYEGGVAADSADGVVLSNADPTKPIDGPDEAGTDEIRTPQSALRTPNLVLRDINLKIDPGQTVAFVGRTGSGKSTLMNLVPRLMDAPEGTLLIDGTPVKEYPIEQLRRAIGFVPQETFLFSNTLAANIAFGVPANGKSVPPAVAGGAFGSGEQRSRTLAGGSDNDELPAHHDTSHHISVEKAAEIAGLADDIRSFPGKYEQLVGERGITLSGGQKQRTAIARAVMRNPRILILDDSLSAVDTYTEEKILHNLRDVRSGRTTLVVSHRVSTIRDADLICVLDHGRIIERGTHDELLELDGEYAELYRRQLLEEELDAEQ